MRFSVRIVSFVLALFLFSQVLMLPVFAAENQYFSNNPPITLPQTDPGVPNDIRTLSQSVILGMLSFATCALSGIDLANANHQCLGYDTKTGKLGYVDHSTGIAGMLTNGIAMTFNKPLGTSDYFRYLGSNFGITKHAYAANQDGFAQLSPLMKLWIGIRNVTYVLFVLVFVIIGFAIMVRAKIDPRTAMTIENQIPKLIIAILLVSFSFAIAGLMIDVMWVLIFVVINLFASLDPTGLGSLVGNVTTSAAGNPFDVGNSLTGGGIMGIAGQAAAAVATIANITAKMFFATTVGGIIKTILEIFMGLPLVLTCAIGQIPVVGSIVSWFTGGSGGDFNQCLDNGMAGIIAGFGATIAFLIFTIALIVALARTWWSLIKSYSLFIIYVIFGPLMIMGGVMNGSKVNFSDWIRHIAAYLLVFPTAIVILLLGKVVMDAYGTNTGFVPPLLGIDPSASSALGPLMGFAIIMLLPQSLTIVQDALQAPDMKYLPGIGTMLAAGTTATTTMINKPWQRLTRKQNIMEGLDEGPLRRLVLGGAGSRRRKLFGDTGGK